MKYAVALFLALTLAGCARPDYSTNIRRVLDARDDVRSRIPSTVPMARVMFPAGRYAAGLDGITTAGCPDAFNAAWRDYVTAWHDRASQSPKGVYLLQAGLDVVRNGDAVAAAADLHKFNASMPTPKTEAAWRKIRQTAGLYGVVVD